MKIFIKPWLRKTDRLVHNPHLWAIIIILVSLALLYYSRIIFKYFPEWFWYVEIFEFQYRFHGSLFFIPFIYASLIFWWRGALITWLSSVVIIVVPRWLYFAADTISVITNMLYSTAPLLIIIYIGLELNWRNKERQALAERDAERQVYTSQILKAQEDERRRIAQELHDDTTQTLMVITNRALALVKHADNKNDPELQEQAQWIRDISLKLSEDVRRLSLDLRPSILDDMGLMPAIRWLADLVTNINTTILVNGANRKLQHGTEITVFRIIQEALNNVRRHSKATEAVVTLEFNTETIKVTVQDNGKGFSLPKRMSTLTAKGKLGLAGMQQRAESLDGTFELHSEPGKGTLVSVEFRA